MVELTMERYGQALVDQTAQFAEAARRAALRSTHRCRRARSGP
jgi:hypothetical protein